MNCKDPFRNISSKKILIKDKSPSQDSATSSLLESQNVFESCAVQSCLTALQVTVSRRYPTHPGQT